MYDNFLHFYFNRITKLWNKIPEIDLSQTAKTKLYKVMWANFINNFSGDNVCSNVHALGVTLNKYVHACIVFFPCSLS